MVENKKLNLEMIEQIDSNQYPTKEMKLLVEINGKVEEVSLNIDKVFRPLKISECVHEFVEKMDYTTKLDPMLAKGLYEVYMIFLIVKHFSDFPAPEKYEDQMKILRKMVDNKLLFEIYAEFDPKEVEKLSEEVYKVLSNFDEKLDAIKEMKDGVEFQNSDIME